MISFSRINEVVDNGLCTRCGTCAGICPQGAIVFEKNGYPKVTDKCTKCGLCLKVCPGKGVDYPEMEKQLFTERMERKNEFGHFAGDIYLGYASDKKIREAGSGGGIVRGLLLYLFRAGEIDGAVVVVKDEKKPWRSNAILATNEREILKVAKSRYAIVPVNQILKELKNKQGRFAVVGLPCQVQGVRKAEQVDNTLAKKIAVVIGLFCHMNIEFDATVDLLKRRQIPLEMIEDFEYRGGAWPGRFEVKLKDGKWRSLHSFDYKDGALNYLKRLYYAKRCFLCIDYSSELADISVGDAWIHNMKECGILDGDLGCSIVLSRTQRGQHILDKVVYEGIIKAEKIKKKEVLRIHLAAQREKKERAAIRISKLKRKGIPFPDYRLIFPSTGFKEKLKEKIFSFTLSCGRFPPIRRLALAIIFSKLGFLLMRGNMALKRKSRRQIN